MAKRFIKYPIKASKRINRMQKIIAYSDYDEDDYYDEYDTWEIGDVTVYSDGGHVWAEDLDDACKAMWIECDGDIDEIMRSLDVQFGNEDLIEPLMSEGYPGIFYTFYKWLAKYHPECIAEWDTLWNAG